MRVLYLTNNPNLGSTARVLQSWLRLGRAAGYGARVVVPRAGDLSRWLTDEGFAYRVDPLPWPDRRRPLQSLWSAAAVARWAGRGTDVIHCNEHNVYPFASLLRRFLRRPVVCHVRFRIERAFCEWAFQRSRPDSLLWTSRQQRDDCAAAVEGLVPEADQAIVPLGLDLAEYGTLGSGRDATRRAWGIAPDEIAIGTASALRPIKRIDEFVEAVARLVRENGRVVGVLAGDAPTGDEAYRDRVLRQIEATGLGRRFRWVGHLEPVEPFYHAVDVFVSTSEYETFGNSVCEAMACRRPVVAYRGGSVAEVVGDAGRIVETGDLDGLVAAVRKCIDDPRERDELGRLGRDRVAGKFNPSHSHAIVRRLYERLTHDIMIGAG